MYWPDYDPDKRKKRARRPFAFLLTLVTALLVAGYLNGWWQLLQVRSNETELAGTATIYSLDESQPTYQPPPTPVPLKNAGAFTLPDLFAETFIYRRSDYFDRPLILNFWASWCVPCREEMPALQKAYEVYQENDLVVLGINETYIDDLVAARDFVDELGLTFPNARDDTGQMSEQHYRIIGLPTSVFITPEGKVAYVQIGQMSQAQIETFSRRLIAGEPITP